MELILLGLCLWASVATGLAWHFYKRYEMGKIIIYALGNELAQVARGDLEIRIVGNEIIRTYKDRTDDRREKEVSNASN